MDLILDLNECQRSRAVAAVDIMAMALERGAPHMALAAAREAARSALLALESVREITELFVLNSATKAASAQSPHVGPMSCAGILSTADLPRTFGPQ